MPLRSPTLLFVLASLTAGPARADLQVVLRPDRDATLFHDLQGDAANGKGNNFTVGRTNNGNLRRSLIAFDVAAAIPAGSRITGVELRLVVIERGNNMPYDHTLNRSRFSWDEGPSSSNNGMPRAALPGDVTWLHRDYSTVFWNNPGSDFFPTVSATTTVANIGPYTWSSPGMVADVQDWLDDPSENHGWLIRGGEPNLSVKMFASRQAFGGGDRPELTIDYLPPPTVYCTAKVNSQGCAPAIGSTGFASAGAGSGFTITLSNTLNNKSGILFYATNGPLAKPFQGGTLCVHAPVRRSAIQDSGGNPPPDDCSGAYAVDFNAIIASGRAPNLVLGATVWTQFWSRDPASPQPTNVSDALEFCIGP